MIIKRFVFVLEIIGLALFSLGTFPLLSVFPVYWVITGRNAFNDWNEFIDYWKQEAHERLETQNEKR